MDDREERLALYEANIGSLLKFWRRYIKLAPQIDFRDVDQEVRIAVWERAGSYNPESGATFFSFAQRRVLGAVRDLIYSQRLFKRGFYREKRGAVFSLTEVLDDEDNAWEPYAEDAGILAFEKADELSAMRMELVEGLFRSPSLNPPDRATVMGRLKGLKESDLGKIMRVTESRISQMWKKALNRLRLHHPSLTEKGSRPLSLSRATATTSKKTPSSSERPASTNSYRT